MKYANIFGLIAIFFVAIAGHSAREKCPPKVSLDLVQLLRANERVSETLPSGEKILILGGTGLDEVHTKLPLSSRKFLKTVNNTGYELNFNGTYSCTYNYDKLLFGDGELTLNIRPIK